MVRGDRRGSACSVSAVRGRLRVVCQDSVAVELELWRIEAPSLVVALSLARCGGAIEGSCEP